jgi:hypothetical protein
MFGLILLHQEMLCFILNELNLVEVKSLVFPLTDHSHPIYILLSFSPSSVLKRW